jgi:hypothetical protein
MIIYRTTTDYIGIDSRSVSEISKWLLGAGSDNEDVVDSQEIVIGESDCILCSHEDIEDGLGVLESLTCVPATDKALRQVVQAAYELGMRNGTPTGSVLDEDIIKRWDDMEEEVQAKLKEWRKALKSSLSPSQP